MHVAVQKVNRLGVSPRRRLPDRLTAASARSSSAEAKGLCSTIASAPQSSTSQAVAVMKMTGIRLVRQISETAAIPQPSASLTSEVMRSGQCSRAAATAERWSAATSNVK